MEDETDVSGGETRGPDAKDLRERGKKWMELLRDAERREEDWLKDAERAEAIYAADEKTCSDGEMDFNILHSNVETIVPSIFNSTPIPDVRERWRKGSEDEPARVASQIIERCIEVAIDDGRLESAVEEVAQDAFVAGRGIPRVKLVQRHGMEALDFESHPWADFRMGPAKKWKDVPWVAFREHVPQEEVKKVSDPRLREILEAATADDESEMGAESEPDAELWQVWDKDERAVLMIANNEIIREEPDPLGLSDFFPCPCPIMPIRPSGKLTPVVPYKIYQRLSEELNRITRRIYSLTQACRAVGLVMGDSISDLESIADADDGTFVPVSNIEGIAATQGLEKAIQWWPAEKVIVVLRELYGAREECKAAIYEITGISDIIRGQGEASETATAQNIKTQWGSLRIKKLQRQLERAVRDIFVISAEIICGKFQHETVQRMSGVEITPEVQPFFQSPLDHFRVDVESDSTVRADLTRLRSEMAQWLEGTAQYMQAIVMPMAAQPQTAPLIPPAMRLYAVFARSFSMGKQGEDAIEELIAATQQAVEQQQQEGPQPDPEQMKAELEQQKMQMQAELDQAKLAIDQGRLELDTQKVAIDRDRLQLDERKAEIEALSTAAEVAIEDEQERPVAIGDRKKDG